MKFVNLTINITIFTGILFLTHLLVQRGSNLDYTVCTDRVVSIDWIFYALLIPFMILLTYANIKFKAPQNPSSIPYPGKDLERAFYLILMLAAGGIFIWRRFRYLDSIPLGITPEMLPRLAEGRIWWENMHQAGIPSQWCYNDGIKVFWVIWANLFGWTIHSYKVLQAVFSCMIVSVIALLFSVEYRQKISTAGGLLIMISSSAYLGYSYRMKWHTVIPAVMSIVLILFYLGEKRARIWHVAAFLVACASLLIYAGNIVHILSLLVCYSSAYFYHAGKSAWNKKTVQSWVPLALGSLVIAVLSIFLLRIKVSGHLNCVQYYLHLKASYNTIAAFQSVFREIFGRGFSCFGTVLYCLGLIQLFLDFRRPVNRFMIAYLFISSMILIPTYGYVYYDGNNILPGLILWIISLGGFKSIQILFYLISPLQKWVPGYHAATFIKVLCCLLIFIPFLICEESLFWNHYILEVSPHPGDRNFQTAVAVEDATGMSKYENTELFILWGTDKSDLHLSNWNFYKCFDEYTALKNIQSLNRLTDLIQQDDTGDDSIKIIYCRNSEQNKVEAEETLTGHAYMMEELCCQQEPWISRCPSAPVLKITILPQVSKWVGRIQQSTQHGSNFPKSLPRKTALPLMQAGH